jgi:Tetracyclin repressor-like, C-terminal domain
MVLSPALAKFPERLEPVRHQSLRSQKMIEEGTLDPIFATIMRLAIDGMWLAENFNLMRFDPNLKAAVGERLIAWTRLQQLSDPKKGGAPGN